MSFTINLLGCDQGNVLFELKIGEDESILWDKEEIDFLFISIIELKELDHLQPVGKLTQQLLNIALRKKQNKQQSIPQIHCSLFKPHHLEFVI
jgi:hypothetical protein